MDGDAFHDSEEHGEFRCDVATLTAVASRLMSGVERLATLVCIACRRLWLGRLGRDDRLTRRGGCR